MNGSDLTLIQRGERRYAIERRYRYLPWYPPSLFSKIMREAVINLSQAADVAGVSDNAASAFMSAAIQPGLDKVQGINPYPLAQDFCATMRTVLEYLSRSGVMQLRKHPDIGDMIYGEQWDFLSPIDDTGTFHRYVFVDHIDDDTIYHHARSWETWADMCLVSAPLQLHLIGIGQTRDARRQSPWCKCYSSPTVARLYKFKRRNGDLQGDWRPLYFADNQGSKATTWVDLMMKEEVIPPLVLSRTLPAPTKQQRADFLDRDLLPLLKQIKFARTQDPFKLQMCRSSCDTPFQCPHEFACYSVSPSVSMLEQSGLYAKIPARKPVAVGG